MFLCSWRIAFGHVSDRLRTCPILDKSEGDPLFGDHFRTICASSPLLSSPLLSCGLAFLLFSSPLSSPRSSPLRGGGRPSTTAYPIQASGKRSCRECHNMCDPTGNPCVDQNGNCSRIYASASDRTASAMTTMADVVGPAAGGASNGRVAPPAGAVQLNSNGFGLGGGRLYQASSGPGTPG